MKAWTHNRKAGLRIGRLWIAIGVDKAKAKGVDYGYQFDQMLEARLWGLNPYPTW